LLVLSLVLPAAAIAANAHVRVEGKTQTIWGTTAPALNATTPRTLEQASIAGEFYYHITSPASALTSIRSAVMRPIEQRLVFKVKQRLAARRRRRGDAGGR